MTMQHESKSQQEKSDSHSKDLRAYRRKHVALWTAVGGTMALIVTLWAILIPTQFELGRSSASRKADRWYSMESNEERQKSFSEALDTIGERIDGIEADERARAQADRPQSASSPAVNGEFEMLRARIEAASKKNEVAPSETDADPDTDTPTQP